MGGGGRRWELPGFGFGFGLGLCARGLGGVWAGGGSGDEYIECSACDRGTAAPGCDGFGVSSVGSLGGGDGGVCGHAVGDSELAEPDSEAKRGAEADH